MATDIGIDFGTSKTILFSGAEILLELPSVATVDSETWEPLYYGEQAYNMIGRTPDSLTTVFPIQRGVIADCDVAEQMLRHYMHKAFGSCIIKPRVMVSVPIGVTSVQHRFVANAAGFAGGRDVCTIESPMAAAIGLGIDFEKAKGSMIIDLGAGTTDIAVITLGGMAESRSCRVASMDFDEAIIKYIKREYNILIGNITAENIKKQIGTVVQRALPLTMRAKGRNLFTGLPQEFEVTDEDVRQAITEPAEEIRAQIRHVLEKTPPDLVSDILRDGIYLTGGGALIHGMEEYLSEYLGTAVRLVDDPLHSVVKGARIALKKLSLLKNSDYQFRSIQELIIE